MIRCLRCDCQKPNKRCNTRVLTRVHRAFSLLLLKQRELCARSLDLHAARAARAKQALLAPRRGRRDDAVAPAQRLRHEQMAKRRQRHGRAVAPGLDDLVRALDSSLARRRRRDPARAVRGRRALCLRVLELERRQVARVHVAHLEYVARCLEDGRVRQEGLVVVDGDALVRLGHLDRALHVVERARLLLLDRRVQRDARLVGVVPGEVAVEGQQHVDD
eukprot:2485944-Prymnesium_polylepis.1